MKYSPQSNLSLSDSLFIVTEFVSSEYSSEIWEQ